MDQILVTMKSNKLYILIIIFIGFACGDSENPGPDLQYLSSFEQRSTTTKDQLELIFIASGYSEMTTYLEYDVVLNYVEYETDYLGETIVASGLLAYPITEEQLPIMSFQHGTMTSHDEAPTVNTTYSLLSNIASAGYILIIPDFIGFGASKDKLHPYYHEESTAGSVVDMIHAAKEFAETTDGVNFNGEVFLSGYSEGGYATMAAHKLMEEQAQAGLTLIASAPAAGGYDIKGVQEFFFTQETYENPYYLGFVAMSYLSVYPDWTLSIGDIFNEPYASKIPTLYDGSKSGSEINAELTTTVVELLTDGFYNELDTDAKYDDIVMAFEQNSLDEWIPQVRMLLYHGDQDDLVPYQNSVDTYDRMISNGASQDIVTFTTLTGEDHGTGFLPYFQEVIDEFENLK